MARAIRDNTNIYRFKVTKSGVHKRDGYGKVKGQAFEEVQLIGPYATKIAFQAWIPNDCDVKVERQQLMAVGGGSTAPELAWKTIEVKHYEPEAPDLD